MYSTIGGDLQSPQSKGLERHHEWKFSYERSDTKRQQLLSFTASFSFDVLRASQDTKREVAHGPISFSTSKTIYLQSVGTLSKHSKFIFSIIHISQTLVTLSNKLKLIITIDRVLFSYLENETSL